MPEAITSQGSEYNQISFLGGMNLLGDDSRLQPNQYRAAFNCTNRYDTLDPVLKSKFDPAAPPGIKQEIVTFGNYIILFVSGLAYYRHYLSEGWTQIDGFKMSSTAPRYWTVAVPVSITNYVRIAATGVANTGTPNSLGAVEFSNVQSAGQGNLPGLLVQDNINQPQFIFLGDNNLPQCRTTQSFVQWAITFTDATNTVVAKDANGNILDNREYVPIGSSMTWEDGVLYITSQDGESILRSVSGRPLDFVINITNILAVNASTKQWTYKDPITEQSVVVNVPAYTQSGGGAFDNTDNFHPGGDAYTTSYSVGVGGIVCLRPMSSGGIFVAASNANFWVFKDKANVAQKQFGEFTLNRQFLFNATCVSDRAIFDSIGDTRFIALTGVRSFNAISQTQNEGRNVSFTAMIAAAFGSEDNPIIQSDNASAAILFNDYELYAVNTIFGYVIAKYDTISQSWTSFDTQSSGVAIKSFAKIELTVRKLYAITSDDKVIVLYSDSDTDTAEFRTVGMCSNILYANSDIKLANPKAEIKLGKVRAIINKVTENTTCSMLPYVNNRLAGVDEVVKTITYEDPAQIDESTTKLPDVNTQLMNLFWSTNNCRQGWKVFLVFKWSSGSFTQFSTEMTDITLQGQSLNSQTLVK